MKKQMFNESYYTRTIPIKYITVPWYKIFLHIGFYRLYKHPIERSRLPR